MHAQNHRHAHLCAHVTYSEIRVVQLRGLNETYASTLQVQVNVCFHHLDALLHHFVLSPSVHTYRLVHTQPVTVCMSTTTTCHALAQEMPIFAVWLESMHPNRLR